MFFNLRYQVTRILPSLKQTIRLPEDVDLLERLNNAMSNAMTDNDRDVSLLARQVNDSYKRTPMRMGECVQYFTEGVGANCARLVECRPARSRLMQYSKLSALQSQRL